MLACPWEVFSTPALWTFLQRLLSDHRVVQLHNDVELDMHAQWEAAAPLVAKLDGAAACGMPARLKELLKHCLTHSSLRHRQRRVVLGQALEKFLLLLQECPAVAAPKLPAVLALLASSAGEISYFALHMNSRKLVMDSFSSYFSGGKRARAQAIAETYACVVCGVGGAASVRLVSLCSLVLLWRCFADPQGPVVHVVCRVALPPARHGFGAPRPRRQIFCCIRPRRVGQSRGASRRPCSQLRTAAA